MNQTLLHWQLQAATHIPNIKKPQVFKCHDIHKSSADIAYTLSHPPETKKQKCLLKRRIISSSLPPICVWSSCYEQRTHVHSCCSQDGESWRSQTLVLWVRPRCLGIGVGSVGGRRSRIVLTAMGRRHLVIWSVDCLLSSSLPTF